MAKRPSELVLDIERRAPQLFADFRKEAEGHGVHDQVQDLCEQFLAQAFVAGTEYGPIKE